MSSQEVAASTTPSTEADNSVAVRARVVAARERQRLRFVENSGVLCNSQMTLQQIDDHCTLAPRMRAFIERIVDALSLSARAVHRSLRVARTIADLEGADQVSREHVAEAMQYRWFDRQREVV